MDGYNSVSAVSGDSADYRHRAEIHRPNDSDALRIAVRDMASRGLTERDVGDALKLDPTAVRRLLGDPQ